MRAVEVAPLIDALVLPPEWSIAVTTLRTFRYRDKLRLVAYQDGISKHGWEGYDAKGGLAYLQKRIELDIPSGLVVTTDDNGWIRTMEKMDA